MFESTYESLLVISSCAWLYSIKADRTTQLNSYRLTDGFTRAAHLKPHTLNRWQTCYLNWKFNMLSILNIDINTFFENGIHPCSSGLKQFGVRLYREPYVLQTCFWEAGIICVAKYFCRNHSAENALGILILNPILTSWKVISYSWKEQIEAL